MTDVTGSKPCRGISLADEPLNGSGCDPVKSPDDAVSCRLPVLVRCVLFITILSLGCPAYGAATEPLKVYILAGQSNMEGHARVSVLDYMGEDPATAPLLAEMKGSDGAHRMIEDVWISYLTGLRGRIDAENREVFGRLTAGYGSQGGRDYDRPGEKIGPELAFGITMQKGLQQPVLLIKTAWGGQSLHTDFRSPGSGPYLPTADDVARERYVTGKQQAELKARTGARYRQMIEHVKYVLDDIQRVVPGYDPGQGYELAGFVWFQGFNDLVARNVYPEVKQDQPAPRFARYTEWFGHFIRDTRKELSAPDLPFVIGVLGVGGKQANPGTMAFRESQADVAAMPEFKGNVLAVPTAPFWDERLAALDGKRGQLRQKRYFLEKQHPKHENVDGTLSKEEIRRILADLEAQLFTEEDLALEKRAKSNAGYHYLGSAKTYSLIGQAFAEALLKDRVSAHPGETSWPGTPSSFHSFVQHTFQLGALDCKVVLPREEAEGRPWVWRARFFGHEPQADIACLEAGFHVAYVDVGGLFGAPRAIERWDAFYEYLTAEHGFSSRPALEGMSRGGLIVYNWAAAHPDRVSCIYADAPVCDFKSWPGGKGVGKGDEKTWAQCLQAYGMTEAEALSYAMNPVDNLEPLAAAGIPLLHVVGEADRVVPVSENTAVLEERYQELGGEIQVIRKKGVGHHPHSLEDPTPIVDFILKHARTTGQ